MQNFEWVGSHINGSRACAVVKYRGPLTKGSRWLATIKRDSNHIWKGSATFEEGPIVAAERAAATEGASWQVSSCFSIDPDTYCVGF